MALWLRQPLIIAFLAVGILVGPAGLQWVTATHEVELLANMGIAVLLFVVGLKLDVHLIKSVGPVALATGLGQIAFTSGIGFLIALALGFDTLPAIYIAVALTFSSTIIIVKLLSDKQEIDSLHGRIAVGFLIVQDICVVIAMILLSGLATRAGAGFLFQLLRLLAVGSGFVIATIVVMRWVMPYVLRHLARSQELLVLFAVAWALSLAALGDLLDFSREVGAFLGGVTIASTPYRDAIAARLTSLRDFLLLFFFIDLGSRLELATIGGQAVAAAVFSLFVLIGNPLIVIAIMGAMGYRRRTGLLAGLTVAQISEFSLILVALGMGLGHVGLDVLGLVTAVGIITIGLSTYMILYSGRLYRLVARPLRIFERTTPQRELADQTEGPALVDVVVLGLGGYGGMVAGRLSRDGFAVLGVDFDPEALKYARGRGIATQYGDIEDPEFVNGLPTSTARLVVIAVPRLEESLGVIRSLRSSGYTAELVATAYDSEAAKTLRSHGVRRVLRPLSDAADEAAEGIASDLAEIAQQELTQSSA